MGMLPLSQDRKVLAWFGSGGGETIHLWDVLAGRELRQLETGTRFFRPMTFSPDGNTLAVTESPQPAIRLWDVASGKERPALATEQFKEKHKSRVERLVFTPDGKYMVTLSRAGQVFFWELATGALRLEWAAGNSFATQLALSSDGNVLLTVDDGIALVWDVPEMLKGNRP
jgi:WD40 repeat protein